MHILIVDDHPLIRDGIATMLARARPGSQLSRASDLNTAIDAIADSPPDIVLLDLGLPDVTGFDALIEIRRRFPKLPLVVLSAREDRDTVLESLRHGATGFIPKNMNSEQIWSALSIVISGGVYLPASVGGTVPLPTRKAHHAEPPGVGEILDRIGLTERQRAVLACLVRGMLNKEIAHEFGLAEPTVKAHVSAIYRAMNVGSRTQAVLWLSRQGLRPEDL
ncbi:MAG: response regulator transcription factor [Sulfuritalea sp.]|nr:response regulator transcription factor [Sulfuritalea sp.]MDP1981419.1 response regulator transcription factor [Sulfuritalea sp.]